MSILRGSLILSVVLLGVPSARAEGTTLDEALRDVATDVKKFLDGKREDSISLGQFRGTGDLAKHSSVSPNLVRELTRHLKALKIEVREKAHFTLQGDYRELEDPVTQRQGVFLKVEILNSKSTDADVVLEKRFIKNETALTVLLGLTLQIPPEDDAQKRKERIKEAVDNPKAHLQGTRINSDENPLFGLEVLVASPDPAKGGKRVLVDYKVRGPESKDNFAFVPIKRDEVYAVRLFNDAPFETDPETIAFKVGTDTFKMELVKIKAGSFKMGSSERELALTKEKFDYKPDDEAEHEVELSAFYMGKYPVTKGQFKLFVQDNSYKTEAEEGDGAYGWNRAKKTYEKNKDYHWKNPGFPQSDDHPVVCVSWNDAKAFCEWLGKKSGKKVRLPSEAQWEYGCRAGSKKLYFFGDDAEDLKDYANVRDASFRTETGATGGIKGDDGYAFTSPVGKFKKNDFGLFDMHGNVRQWCEDGYRKDYENLKGKDPIEQQSNARRVLRGGSWFVVAISCRAADRSVNVPAGRVYVDGFRVVVLP